MTYASLQRGAFDRPFTTGFGFLSLLTTVPNRLLRRRAPHTHVIELVAYEHLGICADVETGGGNLEVGEGGGGGGG